MDSQHTLHLGIVDYVIFVLILITAIVIGLYYAYSGRKSMTVQKYLVGDRKMGIFPVTLSLFATFQSAISMLGLPTEIYLYDAGAFYNFLIAFLSFPVIAFCYVPTFYDLQITSSFEYLEKRFNRKLRIIGSLISILQATVYTSMILYAPALALSQVSGLNLWISVFTIGLLGTIYTTLGGIKAVMWTDVFQAIVIFSCLLIVVIQGTINVGGVESLFTKGWKGERFNLNSEFDFRIRYTVWSVTIGGFVHWISWCGIGQVFIQRYVSCSSKKGAQISVMFNLMCNFLYYVCILFVGLLIYSNYSNCDPITTGKINSADQLFPLFLVETLYVYPGLSGLFIGALFSAALSTISSSLNSIAALLLEDILRNFSRWKNTSSEKLANISKILTAVFGVVSIALVPIFSNLGPIFRTNAYNSHTFGGMTFGLFTLGLFVPWANSFGASVGLFVAFIFSQWISIGSQMNPPFTLKSNLSISECPDSNSLFNLSLDVSKDVQYDVFPLYQISYGWILFLSAVPVILIGMIVSAICSPTKLVDLDICLLSPPVQYCVRKLYPKYIVKVCKNEKVSTYL